MKIGKAMKIARVPAVENGSPWPSNASEPDLDEPAAGTCTSGDEPGRGRGAFLAAGLAALVAGGLMLANMTPHYTARSIVLAGLGPPPGAVMHVGDTHGEGDAEAPRTRLETEIEIIQSGSVLGELTERLRLFEDPEFNLALAPALPEWVPRWLQSRAGAIRERLWPRADAPGNQQIQVISTVGRHISVQQAEASGALAISAWSSHPDRAALLANTLAEIYVRRALDEQVAATGRTLALLRGRLGQLQQTIGSSDRALERRRNEASPPAGTGEAAAEDGAGPRLQGGLTRYVAAAGPADPKSAAPQNGPVPQIAAADRTAGEWNAASAGGVPQSSGSGAEQHFASRPLRTAPAGPDLVAAGEEGGAHASLQGELQAAADRSRALRLELAALKRQLDQRHEAVAGQGEMGGKGTLSPPPWSTSLGPGEGSRNGNPTPSGTRILLKAERPEAGFWPPSLALLGLTGLASTAAAGVFLVVARRPRTRRAQGGARQEPASESLEDMTAMDGGTSLPLPEESARGPRQPDARRQALRQAFTPANPQHNAVRFVGRREQLARVRQAIMEEQAHVCLYGERGRGKTSLANLATEAAREAGFTIARYACTASSSFEDILRGLARSLPGQLLVSSSRQAAGLVGCEAAFPAGPLQPWHVLALPGQLAESHLILMVDEFDRLPNDATRMRIADTIKLLSEHSASVFFLIVGASDSLTQLLDRHPSVQRNVVGVQLPLLTNGEVEEIVLRGGRLSGLEFSAQVRTCIAALARGVPYHAQLLALRAGQAALHRADASISASDLRQAIEQSIAEAPPQIAVLYEGLTQGERAGAMTSLLRAMAAGEQDRFGRFRAIPMPDGRIAVAGAAADPALWSHLLDTGTVRCCIGAGADTYGFAEANFAHYVLLRMVRLVLGFDPSR
ncbi:AAA family ATPase [Teichococcus coralli]|nr:AAA family ATPase [Pseudoroseomonas coralli]